VHRAGTAAQGEREDMSSDDSHKNYLRDLVFRIRENGANAVAQGREAQGGREFQRGRAMAYIEILSMMQNQADVFQIDREELLLSGFDPLNDPLDPPRPS